MEKDYQPTFGIRSGGLVDSEGNQLGAYGAVREIPYRDSTDDARRGAHIDRVRKEVDTWSSSKLQAGFSQPWRVQRALDREAASKI